MFIYVGKTFTATVSGCVIKEVTCEQCGLSFFYELARAGVGQGSAPYYLGQQSAEARSQRRAQEDLKEKLEVDCEAVPCPQCGRVQEAMIRCLAARTYRGLQTTAWVICGLGLVITCALAIFLFVAGSGIRGEELIWLLIAAAGCAGFWFLMMALRRLLMARGKWLNAAIECAPPALLPGDRAQPDGSIALKPVGRATVAATSAGDWVVMPLLRMGLPPVCCECLEPSTTVYRALFKVNENEMEPPLCDACARRIRRRFWLIMLTTIVASLVVSALIPQLPFWSKKTDQLGRWILAMIFAIFATAIGAAMVPSAICHPCRMKVVDGQRGIVRLRFRNPRYTKLLGEMVDELDGRTNSGGSRSNSGW